MPRSIRPRLLSTDLFICREDSITLGYKSSESGDPTRYKAAMEPSPNTHGHPPPVKQSISNKAAEYHRLIPGLRKLPLPVFGIILVVALMNIVILVVIGIMLVSSQHLPSFLDGRTLQVTFSVFQYVMAHPD